MAAAKTAATDGNAETRSPPPMPSARSDLVADLAPDPVSAPGTAQSPSDDWRLTYDDVRLFRMCAIPPVGFG
jgi:hypothetical protein